MKFIIIITFLLTFASCAGKKGKTDAQFTLNLGAIASGEPLTGGLVLKGKSNIGESFQIATTDASNIALPLPNGVWDFWAIGWKNQANGEMTGDNVCGEALGVSLDGADAVVNLTLSMANCTGIQVADANSMATSPTGAFKMLEFESCLTIANFNTAATTCDNSNYHLKQGVSAFIKVKVKSHGSVPGIPAGELSSGCLNLTNWVGSPGATVGLPGTDFQDSRFQNSYLRLPTRNNSTISFPIEIVSYEEAGCLEEDVTYVFPHGLGGLPGDGAASKVFSVDGTISKVVWADNYVGTADSAFVSGSGTYILPFIDCGGANCHNATNPTITNEYPRDNVKQDLFELLGPPKQVEYHDSLPNAEASATVPGTNVNLSSVGVGHEGNNIYFNFTNTPSTLDITDAGGSLDINYISGSSTYQDVVNLINSQGFTDVSANCTGSCSSIFNYDGNVQLTGGASDPAFKERELGTLPWIKTMLIGPVGGILYQNGVQSLEDICSTTGRFSKTIIRERTPELASVVVEAGDIAPPDYMTENNGINFDRKITLELDGVPEMAFGFHCPGGTAEYGVGWFRESYNDDEDGEIEHVEIFYNHTYTSQSAIEKLSYEEDVDGNVKSQEWLYFQKTSNTNWELFSINYYDNDGDPWRSRIGSSGSSSFFYVNQYEPDNMANDSVTDTSFSHSVLLADQSCSYSGVTDNAPSCSGYSTTNRPDLLTVSPDGGANIIVAPMGFGSSNTDFSIQSLQLMDDLDFSPL